MARRNGQARSAPQFWLPWASRMIVPELISATALEGTKPHHNLPHEEEIDLNTRRRCRENLRANPIPNPVDSSHLSAWNTQVFGDSAGASNYLRHGSRIGSTIASQPITPPAPKARPEGGLASCPAGGEPASPRCCGPGETLAAARD